MYIFVQHVTAQQCETETAHSQHCNSHVTAPGIGAQGEEDQRAEAHQEARHQLLGREGGVHE